MPRKKIGSAHMKRLNVTAATSAAFPRLQAANRPSVTPNRIASASAGRMSQSVLTSAWPSMSATCLVAEGVARPQIAARQGGEVRGELRVERVAALRVDEDRLVEAEALAERLDGRRIEARVVHPGLRRVAGQDPEQEEVEGDDDHDRHQRPADLPERGTRRGRSSCYPLRSARAERRNDARPASAYSVGRSTVRLDGSSSPRVGSSSIQPVNVSVRHASIVG